MTRQIFIEVDGRIEGLDDVRVDYRREGGSTLGWFALDHSPLAFLRSAERALFCNTSLARYLPPALSLSEVLAHLP